MGKELPGLQMVPRSRSLVRPPGTGAAVPGWGPGGCLGGVSGGGISQLRQMEQD